MTMFQLQIFPKRPKIISNAQRAEGDYPLKWHILCLILRPFMAYQIIPKKIEINRKAIKKNIYITCPIIILFKGVVKSLIILS